MNYFERLHDFIDIVNPIIKKIAVKHDYDRGLEYEIKIIDKIIECPIYCYEGMLYAGYAIVSSDDIKSDYDLIDIMGLDYLKVSIEDRERYVGVCRLILKDILELSNYEYRNEQLERFNDEYKDILEKQFALTNKSADMTQQMLAGMILSLGQMIVIEKR